MRHDTKSGKHSLIVTNRWGNCLAKTSKSNTSNTDNDANSGSEDIAAMRAELAELRAGKAQADGEVATYRTKLRESELAKMSAQERAILADQETNAANLAALETEASDIERQIAILADEPGHGAEIGKLTRQIAGIETKLSKETDRKAWLETQREKVTNQNKQTREAAPAAGVKLLANGLDTTQFSAKTKAWLDQRPKVYTDTKYANLVHIAAQKAVRAEGLAEDSPEYFRFVEDELKESPTVENDDDGEEEEEIGTATPERESYAAERPQHRAAGPGSMSSAPPTRQTPAGGNGGANRRQISLSADEREAALNIYSHLNISDADKLVKYSEGKKYMAQRNNSHFRN